MLRSAARKKDWTLTKEAFERLLSSLDARRDRAGEKYESVRRKLTEFFEARGSLSPADHADETINRVARKLEEGENVQDLSRYFYGVARLLLKETLRARVHKATRQTDQPFTANLFAESGLASTQHYQISGQVQVVNLIQAQKSIRALATLIDQREHDA